MEENKYYTPKLEEFYVGFEYELLKPDNKYYKRIFGKDIIDNYELDEFNDDLTKIAHSISRVKYLDKEDIESLGFKYYEYAPQGDGDIRWWDGYKKGDYEIRRSESWNNYNTLVCKNNRILFEGSIKNKSELKFILKCLGILEI